MSTKKLYALSEREAAVLRARDPRWTDSAQRATPDPLTPLDTDAAVEHMARAILRNTHGGNVDLLSYNAWAIARSDARAALDAALNTEGGEIMSEEPTVVHRDSVTRRGYYRLENIPGRERAEARFAKLNADIADQAMRDHDADKLHAAFMAMESHQRNTGWWYIPETGEYRHEESTKLGGTK